LGTIDKKQLVAACQAGDREAQGLLYSTYRRKMTRIIRQYVPDCDMSQDVLHDGFLIILSQIQSLRNPEQLEYWMATIMKNLSLHSLSQIQFDDILEEPEEEVDEDPAQELSYEELMALVDQLPDGYRTVFRLAVLEGKSHQEIADMLGISPKSSASQLARAKEKLRALILEHRRQAAMLAVLALFLLPLSLYFVRHRQEVEIPMEASATHDAPQHDAPQRDASESKPLEREVPKAVKAGPMIAEQISTGEERDTILHADTIQVVSEKKTDIQELLAEVPSTSASRRRKSRGWSINVSTNTFGTGKDGGVDGDRTAMDSPSDVPKDDEEETRGTKSSEALNARHLIPITFGIQVSKGIAPYWSVETGLQYTLLRSEYSYLAGYYTEKVRAHFLIIPVALQYSFRRGTQTNLYASGGANLNIPLGASWSVEGWDLHSKLRYPMSVSLNVGLGFEYKVSSSASLFVQPSLNYHMMSSSEYPILWQDKSVTFELPVGIRIIIR
jgi:RNA polymerase sigma-70 factor (ECF subfamily)